ncbi:hypothetical protein [Streptomyces sp. NPDC020747]|uniref:hypothetical protein n=1 Tax=Streptomyces sp. NPDC020747 TaxID=3365086 RepID=UPI00378EA384
MDGVTVESLSPARRIPVSAAFSADEFGGPVGNSAGLFWGRSPATAWRLIIEPSSLASSGLDLSNLSRIQLALAYKSRPL